jgi:hypothetical protein
MKNYDKHIGRLRERLKIDSTYQAFKNDGVKPDNMADAYNNLICKDIEYVLDRLTALEGAVEAYRAELTSRRDRYAIHRGKLFTFDIRGVLAFELYDALLTKFDSIFDLGDD